MSRQVFYENDDFTLSLEEINEQAFVHIEIYRFSKSVLEDILEQWKQILMRFYLLGYDAIYTYTRDPRIVNLVGGSEEIGQDDPDLNNLGVRMYKWDLTQ